MTERQKIVLVTGSTDGVGRYVAIQLGRDGATVLVHGRDRMRGGEVVAEIEAAGGSAQFYEADFSSLDGVRELANAIGKDHQRLDVLVNNAGIGTGGLDNRRQLSRDGYELRFAVNYLSGFLLTYLLMPLLKAAPSARIVNVSSAGQQAIDFDDPMLTRGYSGTRAYCQSKLAQILFTFDLAAEHEGFGITANCLHPASYMDTTMVRAAGISPASTVEEGGRAILQLAASAQLEGRSGLYFDGLRASRANAQAYDLAARDRLRALSLELCGLPARPSA
ncbi:SDR family NAD(P)-dependent oxidoreductase [Rhizobium sp. BK376]|jgi:NAD(P)-dependent dehydrogenase (short-subunit alcohol dehydrogenase family)|uniref:SDR family NAD(P)-dependent oxidoreductase n=1 Tax=Rhizobium sp. BK376 TaxID=2512149 RepID=UPI001048291F|nr:SDR family NAD(P)-dependent oxidoreductase [Rhizobium sp. BK376]TCR91611.1 NAD(P)-dependent dehydrogenase (short-subunit alcohol dehydrogenase family) [Rhizobium sp. BK376]